MRRSLFAVVLLIGLGLSPIVGPPPRAEANIWKVTLSGRGDGHPFIDTALSELADPVDIKQATTEVYRATLNLTLVPTTFSLITVGSIHSDTCVITPNFNGSGKIYRIGQYEQYRVAQGPISGVATYYCGGGESGTAVVTGQFRAETLLPDVTGTVETITGTVKAVTPWGSEDLTGGATVPTDIVITTGSASSAQITLKDGSIILGANTSCAIYIGPGVLACDLHRGTLTYSRFPLVPGSAIGGRTPNGWLWIRHTEFSTRYSQTGTTGRTTISVQSGTVDFTDRHGTTTAISAGQTFTITESVPRVTLILPVDFTGALVQGMTNTLSWTAFDGATGYLLEYAFDPPGFSQPNSPIPEFPNQTVLIRPGGFSVSDGVVEWPVFVASGSVPTGTRVQWRIFPADGAGHILPGTTASDAFTMSVGDSAPPGPAPLTNRLLNPDFEEGRVGWVEFSRSGFVLIVNDAPNAHEGSWYAWLGGYDIAEEHIYQDVTIPADATHASLQFWYRITTSESFGCFDRLVVEARRPSDNTLLGTLATFCNSDSTNGWVQSGPHGPYDVTSLRGQTIRLRFYTTTDGSLPSSFFVDDVALMINGG